jgi:hypothetical protein
MDAPDLCCNDVLVAPPKQVCWFCETPPGSNLLLSERLQRIDLSGAARRYVTG